MSQKLSSLKIYKELDLTSSSCAGPIGELSSVVDELREGEAVKVILGDDATKKDITLWSKKRGLKIVQESQEGSKYVLLISK
ncbi:SirA family protein [Sulfolobus islandicus HVE10/4]|uniref:SirA family protein n=2 Tax=Saccharolobus islandicus TaxID=43080 RepID=F0NDH0_SACI5|nr:sulfurtransferase TusA family protein [Sulfolobus islandicus]ADX83973.1 SirA family protein [Sulfolobus islandicus HVE10/4]ADX86621.1 SirA family protein [Sulfolobus islandicus REY15A]